MCLLQSVTCFDLSQYNCWKNIPWTLKLLFLSISSSKSSVYNSRNLQHKFLDWNDPPFPLSKFSKKSSDLVVGPFPNYPSPQCPLELQSAGLGCTSLAELEEENVLNLPTNQFLCTTSPHKNSRQDCLCQIFQLLWKDTGKPEKKQENSKK